MSKQIIDLGFLTMARFQVDPAVFTSVLKEGYGNSNGNGNGNGNDNDNDNGDRNTTDNNNNNNTDTNTNNNNTSNTNNALHSICIDADIRILSDNFVPGPTDVIAGRGKLVNTHPGNKWFKDLISANLQRYGKAKTKMDKSFVVNGIVDEVRESTPAGGFIRKNSKSGRWQVIDDVASREKVGHAIRDAMLLCRNKSKNYDDGNSSESSSQSC